MQNEISSADRMPWTKPLYTRRQINTAGDVISGRKLFVPGMDPDTALDVAGNWRSSHGYPLHIMAESLKRRARTIQRKPLVAWRLKRMPSIAAKLSRFNNMQLSQMQDLGGCRAVVRSVRRVDKLVRYYETHHYNAADFIRKFDYIENPKPDGYRSVHLVYRYNGDHQDGAYKGLKVEIQIRSRRQHAWATAVETIDTFTGQALKSNIGTDDWRRFFLLAGTAIALVEKCPAVPGSPNTFKELCSELRDVCGKLNVPDVFLGLYAGLKTVPAHGSVSGTYILNLDSKKRVAESLGFETNKEAEEHYLKIEKENKDKPHIQTVMVSLESIRSLRTAYPNFFLDTRAFARLINEFCTM